MSAGVGEQLMARVDELPEGRARRFDAGRFSVCLVRSGDRVFALYDLCPHRQAHLSDGTVGGTSIPSEVGVVEYGRDGEILRCPWHGWEFDVTNGRSLHDPDGQRVRSYSVRVDDGNVYVRTK
jgi:nitrite reductase/ring-hydroxylating ferredoxin subunit